MGYAGVPEGPLSAYLGVRQANEQRGLQDIQGAAGVQGLLAKVQEQEEMKKLQTLMSQTGGDPAKAIPALLQMGSPKSIALASQLKGLIEKPGGQPIGSGGLRMPDGTIVPPAARPNTPFSNVHNVPGGYLTAGSGSPTFTRTQQEPGVLPQSPEAKLTADLKAGRITQAQFDAASKTALGNTAVVPEEHGALTGEDYLKTLPIGLQNSVKAVVEGRVPLTSFSIRNNQRDAMIQRAQQYDPTFEAGKAPARAAVQKDFTSGVAARNVTAINTAIRHLGTLDELGEALNNKDVRLVNTVSNKIAMQLGDPRINNFDAAKSAVGNELMRVFRQVNASEQETKDWEAKFSNASSPAQIKGAIKTGVELLRGRIQAMDEQWMRGMDKTTGYPNLLTPVAKKILEKIGKDTGTTPVQSEGWTPDKEQRYQELLKRRGS